MCDKLSHLKKKKKKILLSRQSKCHPQETKGRNVLVLPRDGAGAVLGSLGMQRRDAQHRAPKLFCFREHFHLEALLSPDNFSQFSCEQF